MSAFASLALKSDNAGSVTETLTPRMKEGGLATWRKSGAVYDADLVATMAVSTSNASAVVRVRQKVVVPVMDAVDTTKKIGDVIVNVEFVLPKKSTVAQRTTARNLARTMVADAVTIAATESFENIYG